MTQLIKYERIETTLPRAKELRRVADQVVTLGKQVWAQAASDTMLILYLVSCFLLGQFSGEAGSPLVPTSFCIAVLVSTLQR